MGAGAAEDIAASAAWAAEHDLGIGILNTGLGLAGLMGGSPNAGMIGYTLGGGLAASHPRNRDTPVDCTVSA